MLTSGRQSAGCAAQRALWARVLSQLMEWMCSVKDGELGRLGSRSNQTSNNNNNNNNNNNKDENPNVAGGDRHTNPVHHADRKPVLRTQQQHDTQASMQGIQDRLESMISTVQKQLDVLETLCGMGTSHAGTRPDQGVHAQTTSGSPDRLESMILNVQRQLSTILKTWGFEPASPSTTQTGTRSAEAERTSSSASNVRDRDADLKRSAEKANVVNASSPEADIFDHLKKVAETVLKMPDLQDFIKVCMLWGYTCISNAHTYVHVCVCMCMYVYIYSCFSLYV